VSKYEEAAREIKAMILADPRDRPWEHEWDVADIVEILMKHFPEPKPSCPNCGSTLFSGVPTDSKVICKGCGAFLGRLNCVL
jgi:hypothetical protein